MVNILNDLSTAYCITALAESERPRERLARLGAQSLSNAELLAILLRVAVTRTIVQAGKLMDVEVLDHLVIGLGRFVSLKERGLGFGQ